MRQGTHALAHLREEAERERGHGIDDPAGIEFLKHG